MGQQEAPQTFLTNLNVYSIYIKIDIKNNWHRKVNDNNINYQSDNCLNNTFFFTSASVI